MMSFQFPQASVCYVSVGNRLQVGTMHCGDSYKTTLVGNSYELPVGK
jgi:hypothetical protein